MEHDLRQLAEVAPEERGGRLADELVAGAVETVAADPVLPGEIGVDRVRVCGRRERLMERGVEHGHVRHIREHGSRRDDAGEVGRVVQRSEHRELLDLALDVGVDERGGEEARPSVHDAMPDGHRRMLLEGRPMRGELLEHDCERRVVVGDAPLVGVFRVEHRDDGIRRGLRPHLVLDRAELLADPLDQTACQLVLVLDVDQAVFQRRRAAVDDEDRAHDSCPCAWMAVMATVLTMSSTSAPRDRSLMGLFSP